METKVKTTREAILEQLHENTGSHFLDSGGAYGRHHERNRGKTWEELTSDPVTLEASVYRHGDKPTLELLGYIKVGAWMESNLEFNPELQAQYDAWCGENDPEYEMYDMTRMEDFAESVHTGNKKELHVCYTYNEENDLSQDMQFIEFCTEGAYHDNNVVLIQLHQGCDARGGLGSPVAYTLKCEYFGQWRIDGYGCNSKQWDQDGRDSNDSRAPGLHDYPVHELEWVSTLEHDLECLKQTNKDDEVTREEIRVGALTAERDAFEEFCDALTEHSIVVFNRKAYYVGDEGPEEIFGECYGMYN